jgi:hypothetical protein
MIRLREGLPTIFTFSNPTSMSLTQRFLVQLQLLSKSDGHIVSVSGDRDEMSATHTSDSPTPSRLAAKPHSRPVFGVSLYELFSHDSSANPHGRDLTSKEFTAFPAQSCTSTPCALLPSTTPSLPTSATRLILTTTSTLLPPY